MKKDKKKRKSIVIPENKRAMVKGKWHDANLHKFVFIQSWWRTFRSQRRVFTSSSYYNSTVWRALHRLKAAHKGWKTRKIIESTKV